jgi:hypothetical protein
MQILRNAHLIARFVLVWFALSIGVAIASPLVKPQAMELICTGTAGVMKLLVQTDDGPQDVASYTMDCPAHVLQSIPAAHIAALTAAPLPARGPPAFS